ncbi:lipopolysaccharide biosynthesis protein [Bosea sp. (in: a-proteobacteria)]|uniref:lipopolysaccharide biosynthesis protein n=1 Tax=Bosea sp. (in: a-proteobacteria) TaxID=1871050 RepID=UPI002605C669|nr:oligosaccharide flippase family protein [Bosea sp. (in: a-proteobacteria)]MCO5091032.1 oligosaccharide flippase family protein [Bosea sp. (in: a-proteobacteria)]
MKALSSILHPLRGLARKRFVRDVATVAGGTAAAQAISFAFYPIITRLYGPEAFGTLGVFMSVLAVLASIAGLAYPIAIVLPKSDEDARGLVRLSLAIAVIVASAAALILVAFSAPIISLLGLELIAPFVFLLPLVVLFTTLLATVEQWLIRTGQFALIARMAVLQALVVNGVKAALGLVLPLASVLIATSIAGVALHAGMLELGRRWNGHYRQNPFPAEPKKSASDLVRTYRDFPLFRAPQELLNSLSHGLPVILLAAFYGSTVVGFYTLAYSFLAAPVTLVGRSVGNVLYPRLAEAANRGQDLRRLVVLPTAALLLTGIIPFGAVMIAGPRLFAFVFGAQWQEAGEYARWLSLWIIFGFANIPSVKAAPVINKQNFLLIYGVISLIFRVLSVYISYILSFTPVDTMIFIGLSGAVANIILIYIIYLKIK